MNDRSFQIVEENVARRRRRLNALASAQIGGLITMSLTLVHLIAVYLGLMTMIEPWWWLIVANAAGLVLGSVPGRRRAVNLQGDLYRLDRTYALGEKLSTIHEIRRRDDRSPYLRLLYDRVGSRELNPKQALRPSPSQRRGWAAFSGVATASVALLALWFVGIPPLSVSSLFASDGSASRPFVAAQQDPEVPESATRDADSPNASRDLPGAGDERTADPCNPDDSSSPALLSRDDREGCEESSRSASGSSTQSTSTSSSEGSSDAPRMSVQRLRRELQRVQERAATGNLSMEDAQRELEQLAQEARSPSMEQLLQQASRAQNLDDLQQRLQDALNELDRQAEQAQQGSGQRGLDPDADLQRRSGNRSAGDADRSRQGDTGNQSRPSDGGSDSENPQLDEREGTGEAQSRQGEGPQRSQSGSGPNEGANGEGSQNAQQGTTSQSGDQASREEGQGEAESGQGDRGEQASSGSEQGSQAGNSQSDGQSEGGEASEAAQNSASQADEMDRAGDARPDSRAQGEQEGAGSPGGSSPGTGPGGDSSGQPSDSDASSTNNLRIQSPDLPQDVETLRALMTRGVPFDVSGSPAADGTPQLELNPDRVETLLRSRDLPPEVRDLVRAYFLSLAEGE